MTEKAFVQSYATIRRLVAARAAASVVTSALPADFCVDLEQEALMELWRKRAAYDPRRGSWRTFSERVVANRMTSLLRSLHSESSWRFREDPLEGLDFPDVAHHVNIDLRADVRRVLERIPPFDRTVALSLVDYSATETGHRLRVSRSTVYRAIERLRAVFAEAGLL